MANSPDLHAESMTRKPAPSRRNLSKADYQSLAQFRYLLRKFLSFSESAAQSAGLTPRHHQALLAIHGFSGAEPVTVGALAERLDLRHHSVVGLVDRLSAKGLVRRHRDPADARRVALALTPKGLELLEGLSHVHRNELRRLAPLLKRLMAQMQ
jgi:DNA-binding MarR family transcriptional regulator